jgi:hypothetical protein
VKELNLIVQLSRDYGPSSNIAIPNIVDNLSRFAEMVGKNRDEIINVPFPIKAYEVIRGWALFKVNNEILQDEASRAYAIKVIDAHNIESSLPLIIFQEKLIT